MPRFYFDVYNGAAEKDEVGVDFPSSDIALFQAARIACQHALRPSTFRDAGIGIVVEVFDESRILLQTVRLVLSLETNTHRLAAETEPAGAQASLVCGL